MSKVSLKDLATQLGVSASTVSKALRDSHEISEKTKEKIIDFAREIGYTPNPYAGHLRHQKSRTIAMVVPELLNNFFIEVISGAELVARENDYHLLIYVTQEDFGQEQKILKHLSNGRVDGVIMALSASTNTYQHIEAFTKGNIPLIFFDRVCHEIETIKIITDDFASAFKATEHLIKNECRDIAFLSLSDNLSIANKRKQGYLEALQKHDIPAQKTRIVHCDGDEMDNLKKIKRLLSRRPIPDAIFASVEKLALSVYRVCQELEINIPRQLKIISFSNLRTAPLLSPPLTTIHQPAYEMGRSAATYLLRYLKKKPMLIPNENVVIKSKLITRNSTQKLPGNKKS